MYIDVLLRVSVAQAFGALAVSTSSIDLGLVAPGRQIGTGTPMGFGFKVDVAGSVADSLVEIISATDALLTAGILVHGSITIKLAAAVAGALFFIPLPPGTPTQQFLGIRVTTAGGTISGTAWLTAANLFSIIPANYKKGYTVS